MTGGSLPAQTWHDIMEYGHRGLELRPLPGFPLEAPAAAAAASSNSATSSAPVAQNPSVLTHRSGEALGAVEKLFRTSGDRRADADSAQTRSIRIIAGGNEIR